MVKFIKNDIVEYYVNDSRNGLFNIKYNICTY